jgi:hypothetical protein
MTIRLEERLSAQINTADRGLKRAPDVILTGALAAEVRGVDLRYSTTGRSTTVDARHQHSVPPSVASDQDLITFSRRRRS